MRRSIAVVIVGTLVSGWAGAQGAPGGRAAPVPPPPPSPPATKIEAFKPAAGTVVTFGYNELGAVSGIEVDVRELRAASGAPVRGLLVEVTENQYRVERAFVDADEIPELLRGIDALLAVKANPTAFDNFEVRYRTKGALQVTAFNYQGRIMYAVAAGETLRASSHVDADALRRLREMFQAAQAKLGSLSPR